MMKLVYEEKIYTYHIDIVGHVNNIIYIQWLENGRVNMLDEMGIPVSDLTKKEGVVPILTETNIMYKKPFFIHNSVRIETWVSKLNNASAILEFRLYNEKNELCASAWQKGLFINRETMRPARLSEKHRKAFEKFLVNE